jgi:hypothetical protein
VIFIILLDTFFTLVSCFIPRPWRRRSHVPPKRLLTFNGLQDVTSQKTELFTSSIISFRFSSFIPIFRILKVGVEWVHSCFGSECLSSNLGRRLAILADFFFFLCFSSMLPGKYLYSTLN